MHIQTLLDKKCPGWRKREMVNHGMGFLSKKEHDHLISINAIRCENGTDSILANYPIVKIRKGNGDDETIDLGGDLFQTKMEAESLRKQGKNAKVEYYAKNYFEYYEKKEGQAYYQKQDDDAMEALVRDAGFLEPQI